MEGKTAQMKLKDGDKLSPPSSECWNCECELSEPYIQEEIKYRGEVPDMCRECEVKEAGRM